MALQLSRILEYFNIILIMNIFMGWNIIFQCHCILYNFNLFKFLSLLHGKMAKTSSLLVKLERYDVLVGWGSRVIRGLFSLPNRHALSKSFPGRHGRGLNATSHLTWGQTVWEDTVRSLPCVCIARKNGIFLSLES